MANTKEIKTRIESVKDTRKITNAMYLIASTKLRKARNDLDRTRPYFEALRTEIKRIFRTQNDVDSRYFYPPEGEPPLEILPRSRLKLDDLAAIADAATAGMGLAWLPAWLIADRIHEGALVPLLSHQPPHLYPAYALWLATPHLPLKTRLAVDALAAGLPEMMG